MPLCTRRSQASVTSYGSMDPTSTGNSKCTNRITSFRELPSYPTPNQRKEIFSTASSSSFQTSYILPNEASTLTDSHNTDISDVSRQFWQIRDLERGRFNVDGSSEEEEAAESETVSNLSYSTIHETPRIARDRKEAFRFNIEGTGAIQCIFVLQTGQCWITRHNDKMLYLYHRNGHKKEARSISLKLTLIARREDKTILAVPHLAQAVYKMSPTGSLAQFLSFDLQVGGVCCTSRSETLVTTTPIQRSQKKGPRPRKVPSVIRFSQTGEVIWCIKNKGVDPFVRPSKVAVNKNGDICVLDHEPSREHVVFLSPDGEEKRRYYGVQHPDLVHPFAPRDVCCDRKGHVYVADLHNSVVHVLDKTGRFSHFLFKKHDGNPYPVAIACETDGFVWVGLSSGAIRIYDTNKT
ncbi:uncharacterized protein LOC128213786 [Mya arenaria]|uniref:uncharacterized protein LOC128213786 n=1 Tax=Mya arenaria TaxID=6604 RepID=UPI0022E22CCC|nr:uncharacterized protein LOC128213786 [Mya arenaria]